MRLDIIIPTYNEYENLTTLLPYLQTHIDKSKTRVIVADAPSTNDDTARLCEDLNIAYYKTERTCRAHQLNYGASQSQGEALLFLHADVRPPEDFMAQIEKSLAEYAYGIFAYKFSPSSVMLRFNEEVTKTKGLLAGGGDQSLFITRVLFNKVGGYDATQTFMEDFEFFSRLQKESDYTIIQSPAIVSSRKYDENSWLRVNLVNLIAFGLFKSGAAPEHIKRFCHKWLKQKKLC